jgi:hypothetical protein
VDLKSGDGPKAQKAESLSTNGPDSNFSKKAQPMEDVGSACLKPQHNELGCDTHNPMGLKGTEEVLSVDEGSGSGLAYDPGRTEIPAGGA